MHQKSLRSQCFLTLPLLKKPSAHRLAVIVFQQTLMMSDFSLLLDLNQNLFEKVISKLQPKSYFRLRQTCREMNERIQSSNISVDIGDDFAFQIYFYKLTVIVDRNDVAIGRELEDFYGTRVADLAVDYENDLETEFEPLCEGLKKNRITSKCLHVADTDEFTFDRCLKLMRIVKPEEMKIRSDESQLYEVLFQSKILKRVEMSLDSKDFKPLLPRLLSTFQGVTVRMHEFSQRPRFDLLRAVQQSLYAQNFPQLLNVTVELEWRKEEEDPRMTMAKLEEQFPECRLVEDVVTPRRDEYTYLICHCENLPKHFPPGSSFKFTFKEYFNFAIHAIIEYQAGTIVS